MQFVFLAVNAIGILLATIYNASTPDLYPNNAHHTLGWVVTWIMVAQIVMGVITIYTGRQEKKPTYLPVSSEAMAEHHRWQGLRSPQAGRFSNDSGQGTERNTESLRSQSISSSGASEDQLPSPLQRPTAGESNVERQGLLRGTKVDQFLSKRIPGMLSSRVLRVGQFLYDVVDRTILLVGFAALTSGIVTYSGLFVSNSRWFYAPPSRVALPTLPVTLEKLYPAFLSTFFFCCVYFRAKLLMWNSDGPWDLQRARAFHQGRRFLLVRHPDAREVGRLLC